jgi:hypothetical protein
MRMENVAVIILPEPSAGCKGRTLAIPPRSSLRSLSR